MSWEGVLPEESQRIQTPPLQVDGTCNLAMLLWARLWPSIGTSLLVCAGRSLRYRSRRLAGTSVAMELPPPLQVHLQDL